MFFMISGLIAGIITGWLVVRFVPKAALGWTVMGLGAAALFFILPGLLSILIPTDVMFSPIVSIPLAVACLVSGIGAIRKNESNLQVRLGLGLGVIPILFWTAFVIGEILFPH